MATIEVNLKEGDAEPEQHLEDGEHIERVVVPLDQLYDKLQGKCPRPLIRSMKANRNSVLSGEGQDRRCQVSL